MKQAIKQTDISDRLANKCKIFVSRNGVLRYGDTTPDGWPPVYSMPNRKKAMELLVLACSTSLDGEFLAPGIRHAGPLELRDLDAVGSKLVEAHRFMSRGEHGRS